MRGRSDEAYAGERVQFEEPLVRSVTSNLNESLKDVVQDEEYLRKVDSSLLEWTLWMRRNLSKAKQMGLEFDQLRGLSLSSARDIKDIQDELPKLRMELEQALDRVNAQLIIGNEASKVRAVPTTSESSGRIAALEEEIHNLQDESRMLDELMSSERDIITNTRDNFETQWAGLSTTGDDPKMDI